jgi:hypothetical protein
MTTTINVPAAAVLPSIEAFEAFNTELSRHDWTYDYSDDGRVWRRGVENERKLQATANSHPIFKEAMRAYKTYHFPADHNQPWPERQEILTTCLSLLRQQIFAAA